MTPTLQKYLWLAAIFLVLLASGYVLTRLGKPYSTLLLTAHKLVGLGAVVFVGITAFNLSKVTPLTGGQTTALAVCGACFLLTIVSGGLISALAEGGLSSFSEGLRSAIRGAHHILPYLCLAGSGLTLFLLIGWQ